MTVKWRFIRSITEADRLEWNRVTRGPFFSYEWFEFVEGVNASDIMPHYFLGYEKGHLVAALPAFIPKTNRNTYENYLFGRIKTKVEKSRLFQRRPLICYSPASGGAYFLTDNANQDNLLPQLVTALEAAARDMESTEIVFLYVKESENPLIECLEKKSFDRVYLNSVGVLHNRFQTMDDYLKSLSKRRRKSVKEDIRRFNRSEYTIDTRSGNLSEEEIIYELVANIDRKYPSVMRDYSISTLSLCLEKMATYRTTYFVSNGVDCIGTLTHFAKDDILNTYAFGLDFEKAYANRTYFNLLYYHTISEMIRFGSPCINFNQMAYKVKESRGCRLMPQYMFVKVLRSKIWMKPWLKILDKHYHHKFKEEYGRNENIHNKIKASSR